VLVGGDGELGVVAGVELGHDAAEVVRGGQRAEVEADRLSGLGQPGGPRYRFALSPRQAFQDEAGRW